MSRIAFITGATSGFGKAIARTLAERGWNLIITGRRETRLLELSEELSKQVDVLPLCFDVRDKSAALSAIAEIPEPFRAISVLVNNAGLALDSSPAQRSSLDDWETMVDTNIKGILYCTHALLPALLASSSPATIVNIGSVAGNWVYPNNSVYGATKAFVRHFSLNLRCDLVGTGVRVTNIEPGLARTEFSDVRYAGDQEKSSAVYRGTDPITPDDIANTVAWIVDQPQNVNINSIEVMANCQGWDRLKIVRQ